jgi:hypothetical protein
MVMYAFGAAGERAVPGFRRREAPSRTLCDRGNPSRTRALSPLSHKPSPLSREPLRFPREGGDPVAAGVQALMFRWLLGPRLRGDDVGGEARARVPAMRFASGSSPPSVARVRVAPFDAPRSLRPASLLHINPRKYPRGGGRLAGARRAVRDWGHRPGARRGPWSRRAVSVRPRVAPPPKSGGSASSGSAGDASPRVVPTTPVVVPAGSHRLAPRCPVRDRTSAGNRSPRSATTNASSCALG